MSKKAVVLLSGGLDSATVLAMAQEMGYECHAMSFRYGQRHLIELHFAETIARGAKVDHRFITIDLGAFGGSALTDHSIGIPEGRSEEKMGEDIPVTYVPARNTIFLSFAMALAEVLDAKNVFIGVNHLDYSGYPDCRPEFISRFNTMAKIATKHGLESSPLDVLVKAPLIEWDKKRIIEEGMRLGVDYAFTISCYQPGDYGKQCGVCDSCILRAKGFKEAGYDDPAN